MRVRANDLIPVTGSNVAQYAAYLASSFLMCAKKAIKINR